MPATVKPASLPDDLRAEMIDYLVKNEKPKNTKVAKEWREDWQRHGDDSLIEAYNYNRAMNGLPERRFEREDYR